MSARGPSGLPARGSEQGASPPRRPPTRRQCCRVGRALDREPGDLNSGTTCGTVGQAPEFPGAGAHEGLVGRSLFSPQGAVQGPAVPLPALCFRDAGGRRGGGGGGGADGSPGRCASGLHFFLLFALFQEGRGSEFLFLLGGRLGRGTFGGHGAAGDRLGFVLGGVGIRVGGGGHLAQAFAEHVLCRLLILPPVHHHPFRPCRFGLRGGFAWFRLLSTFWEKMERCDPSDVIQVRASTWGCQDHLQVTPQSKSRAVGGQAGMVGVGGGRALIQTCTPPSSGRPWKQALGGAATLGPCLQTPMGTGVRRWPGAQRGPSPELCWAQSEGEDR